MSRIIKFRAWHKEKYKMWGVDYIDFKDNCRSVGLVDRKAQEGMRSDNSRDLILMQFTGLTDKNGKEIYEGDICRGPNGKCWVIGWEGHSWCMTNEIIPNGRMKFGGEETYTIDRWLALPPTRQSLEIIGNIYENPELLKP